MSDRGLTRPFARRLKYGSVKETLGKLVEWGAAGIDMRRGASTANRPRLRSDRNPG